MEELTDEKLKKISEIVQKHTDILNYIVSGSPPPDTSLLSKLGISLATLSLVRMAYLYGKNNAALPEFLTSALRGGKNLPVPSIRQIEKTTLNAAQERVAARLAMRANQTMNNFSQRTVSSVTNAAINIDLHTWTDPITRDKRSTGEWIQILRDTTKDMERDWHRVVQTELWDAKIRGEAQAIIAGDSPYSSDGGETMVYKRPAPDCCAICRKLYLEKDGVTPKVFKLSELMANGTNVGLKQGEWKAVLGVVHPNCQCTLGIKPPDTEFDKDGNLVYKPKP